MRPRAEKVRIVGNLNKAAFLVANGLAVIDVRAQGDYVDFIFDDGAGRASALVQLWDNGRALVPAGAFVDAQHTLRTLIVRYKPKPVPA
jgi:hypothetical protein